MRPRPRAPPRGSARATTLPRGPARRASASPWRPPAPSASEQVREPEVLLTPGSGRRSGQAGGSRPRAPAAGGLSQPIERSLVSRVGDRQVLGERAPVASHDLAGVERDRDDRALAGAKLGPAAREPRVERVVVGVEAQIGLLGHRTTRRSAVGGSRSGSARIRSCSSARRSEERRGCRGESGGWRGRRTSAPAGPGSRARSRTSAPTRSSSAGSDGFARARPWTRGRGPRGSANRRRAGRNRRRRSRSAVPGRRGSLPRDPRPASRAGRRAA